jgi:hypothetical protein
MIEKLKKIIFRGEYARLKRETQWAEATKEMYAKKLDQALISLLREQLKGFDPKLLDSDSDIEDWYGDIDSRTVFLEACHELFKNPARKAIQDFLKRNQLQHSVIEATDLQEINFGRATINGLTLFEEEVERLNTIYLAEHPEKEKFDPSEVV